MTQKQLDLCYHYIHNGRNIKKAAQDAGYSKNYSEKKAYTLLKQSNIKEKIEELERDYYSEKFSQLAYKSLAVLEEMIDPDSEFMVDDKTRLAAVKEIFKFYNLEQKLNPTDKTTDTQFNIVFNEVTSRDT